MTLPFSHAARDPGPAAASPAASAPPRISGLDGLRAFSIALVLVSHLQGTRNFWLPSSVNAVLGLFELGNLGVRVFFVISGFLITTLLLGEEARAGQVSLARFYFRRTLRIFPPFYLYLAVIGAVSLLGVWAVAAHDLLHAATYTINYERHRAWLVGHAWSLSIEEQFYLLWPALFCWLGRRRAAPALVLYLLLAPAWRLALSALWPQQRLGIGETFFTTADAIATGCLLAIVRPRLTAWSSYRRWVDSAWFHAVPPALLAANALWRYAKLDWLVGMSLQYFLIAIVIERLTRENGWIAAPLKWRPVALLGTWSYSVYLWQQLFLNRNDQHSAWTAFPGNIAAALCVAAMSYYLVERPVLRWREHAEQRWFGARPRGTAGPRTAA